MQPRKSRVFRSIGFAANTANSDALSQSCQAFIRASRDARLARKLTGGSIGTAPASANRVPVLATATPSPAALERCRIGGAAPIDCPKITY